MHSLSTAEAEGAKFLNLIAVRRDNSQPKIEGERLCIESMHDAFKKLCIDHA